MLIMQNKFIHSNKGLTLVELLATLTILSFIGIVIYSVLFNGIRSYERTMEETKLRDEADYIMANFIDEFFTLKVSDIDVKQLPNETNNLSYITIKKGTEEKQLGFKDGKVVLINKELEPLDSNVELSNESKIIATSESEYMVALVLQTKDTKRKLELTSIFNILDDRKEVNQNAINK